MFFMKGQLRNCFSQPPTEQRPHETYKIQIEGQTVTKDEQTRFDLVSLNVPFEIFQVLRDRVGQMIALPVGLMVAGGNGRLQPYFPKGYTREVLSSAEGSTGRRNGSPGGPAYGPEDLPAEA